MLEIHYGKETLSHCHLFLSIASTDYAWLIYAYKLLISILIIPLIYKTQLNQIALSFHLKGLLKRGVYLFSRKEMHQN